MSPNRDEAMAGLELLPADETVHSNGNGITTSTNGHSKYANGTEGAGGLRLNSSLHEFQSGDPFPLGLGTVPKEFRRELAFSAKTVSIDQPAIKSDVGTTTSRLAESHRPAPPEPTVPRLDHSSNGVAYEVHKVAFNSLFMEDLETTRGDAWITSPDSEPIPDPPATTAAMSKEIPIEQDGNALGLDDPITEFPKPFQNEPFQGDIPGLDSSPYRTVWLTIPDDGPIFPFDGVDPRVAEQYRILRTAILLHPSQPKVIAISSGSAGDGKTLTAINFAGIVAMKDEVKILIVEADLRKCSLAPTLGLEASPGLAEVLSGKASLEEAIIRAGQLPNFHILTGGEVKLNPAELLDSPQFRQFVEDVRQMFTYVVFDTTPAASVADFKLVMQVSDGVLMVVRPEHTDRPAFQRAFELIPEKKLLGAVINAFEDWFLWNKVESNYYYSGERRAPKKAQPFFRWRRRATKV